MILLLTLWACEPTTETAHAVQTEAVATKTGLVEAAEWAPTLEITGSLDPIAAVELGFDVPGRLQSLVVQRGQAVRKGDAVARLDDNMARSQLAQAEAAFSAASSQAEAAAGTWSRVQKLGDMAAEQQRGDARAMAEAAGAQRDQAEAAVKLARTQLAWHTLRAPISGVVTRAPDNAGILVGAGTPLFVIEDLSALRLKGTAPESEAWVAAGQPAEVFAGTPGVSAPVVGVVERVIPSLDPSTRRLPVEVRVDDPPETLRAHAFARARIASGTAEQVFAVPRRALVAQPDFSVWRATEPPIRVPVVVLHEGEERVLVRGALTAGEPVVIDVPHGFGG